MTSFLLSSLWLLMIAAAVLDLASRRIPNPLIIVGLILGPLLQVGLHGLDGLLSSLAGIGVAFAVLIIPFAMRWMGGGDVKLTMVVGAFLGWKATLIVIVLAHVLHLGVALVFVTLKRLSLAMGRQPPAALNHLPKAVAIAAAVLLVTTVFSR